MRLLLAWRRTLTLLPAVVFCAGLLSPWLAIEREAPYELALLNMTAGLAWATTIVNVRQPELMENFISMNGDRVSRTPAFTNGLMSTLIMGIDITPNDPYIMEFSNTGQSGQTRAGPTVGHIGCAAGSRGCEPHSSHSAEARTSR